MGRGSAGGDAGEAAPLQPWADDSETPPWSWRQFGAFCGPGLLMSVAYLVSLARTQ